MLQALHSLKSVDSCNQEAFSIEHIVVNFGNRVKKMLEGVEKNEGKKIIKIVSKILEFYLNERKQRRQGIKILTPSQMLGRWATSLAQLKAGNNSEKLTNEIRQLLHSLYRSKKLANHIYKSLTDIIQNMETVFMNSENNTTNEPRRFKLDLTDKLNLKDPKTKHGFRQFEYLLHLEKHQVRMQQQ